MTCRDEGEFIGVVCASLCRRGIDEIDLEIESEQVEEKNGRGRKI